MAGISLDMTANAKPFLKGVKDVEGSLDDLSGTLDDVVRDATKSGDKLGDGLADGVDDGTRDASKSTERLEQSFSDLARSSKKVSVETGDNISGGVKKGTDGAADSLGDMRNEASSVAGETASSFDGSADSILGAFQDLTSKAFAGFGPAGEAAGLIAAVGIGAAVAVFQSGVETTDEWKTSVQDLATEMIDAGSTGTVSFEALADKIKELAVETDTSKDNLKDISVLADRAAVPLDTLAEAYAGNTDGLDEMIEKNDELYARGRDSGSSWAKAFGSDADKAEQDMRAASGSIADSLREVKDRTDAAAESEKLWVEAGGPELVAKSEATAAYAESIQSSLLDAGGSWEDFADDEGGLDLAAYVANFEAKAAAITDYQSNVAIASSTLNTEALGYIETLGADAAPLLDAYVNAPLDQQADLERVWSKLGTAGGETFTADLAANVPDSMEGPSVKVDADTREFDKVMSAIKRRSIKVRVIGVDRNGKEVL
jgi:hypothetical protein